MYTWLRVNIDGDDRKDVILEITCMFWTSRQNDFRNTCYLEYSIVTSTLRLFANYVLNFSNANTTA